MPMGPGFCVSAHEEWRALVAHGSDMHVIAAMTSSDGNVNRLRQSSPYAGLITQEKRHKLLEAVGFFIGRSGVPEPDNGV